MIWFGTQAWREGWLPYEKTVLAVAWITPVLPAVLGSALHIVMTPLILLCFFASIYYRYLQTSGRLGARPRAG